MNVLIAANYGTPNSGNFVGSLIELGLYMNRQGNNVYFVFPMNANTTDEKSWVRWLEHNGFKVYLCDIKKPNDELITFLLHIIRENSIDLLHIHFGLFHSLAMHNRRSLPVHILVHEHMEYPAGCNKQKQTALYALKSLLYRYNRISVVCVNESVSKALLFCKCWYVPNGISFKRNTEYSMGREERRKQLGFSVDDKIVMFLGWDVYRKGLDIAVKAIQECRKRNEHIKLAIVGLGNPPKRERVHFIETSTDIDPKEPWIYYLPGTDDMFSYHRAADVYLSASRSEAFSYGLLEAISQDKPIVVSNIKGTSWSLDYNRAFSYEVEDYMDCSNRILKAVESTKTTDSSNYADIIQKYSIQNWISAITNVYESIMNA